VNGLTARQQEVVATIRAYIAETGRPPTLREIGRRMGIGSTNGVTDHLRALQRKGVIAVDSLASRGIRLLIDGVPAAPSAIADNTPARPFLHDVHVNGTTLLVNGRIVARFASPESANGLARNLRLALGMVDA